MLTEGPPGRGEAGESGREDGGSDQDASITRVRPSRLSVFVLLLGMIRCSQPGRLLPALSGCPVEIAATRAFGISYGSIWQLADAISIWRLVGVSSFSVLALSGWLILRNGLWHFVRGNSTWRTRLDNAATVGTILLTTALIYLLALVLMMVLTVVIIPVDYLSGQLQYPAGLSAHLSIAAFTASLGTMAGAIGSNFDKEVEIRSATCSRREHQRRQRSGYYRDQDQ